MAVELQGAGDHQVQLRYNTPGRATGAVLTAAGLVALAAVVLLRRRSQNARVGKHARRGGNATENTQR